MRDDLTYWRAYERERRRRQENWVGILFAVMFMIGLALLFSGCATQPTPANDYAPVKYSAASARSGGSDGSVGSYVPQARDA